MTQGDGILLASALLGAVVGAAGGAVLVVMALARWLEARIDRRLDALEGDSDLRPKRIEAYRSLWQLTGLVSSFRRTTLSYRELDGLADGLARWYSEKGGIYLPESTVTDRLMPLQQTVLAAVERHRDALDREVSDEDHSLLRDRCSALRRALAEEVQGRREPRPTT